MVLGDQNEQRHHHHSCQQKLTVDIMNQREIEIFLKKTKRNERIFLAIAAIAVIGSLFIFYRSNNNRLSAAKYELLNPSRRFYNSEDLIINIQPLRDYLSEKYEADPDVSVYLEFLNTGANISISKDAEFYPASLLKVPIAMAVMKKIERGDWKLSNELVITNQDKDEDFGNLYKQPAGTTLTIEVLLREMLSNSDNTAKLIFVRNLEIDELRDVYKHLGLDQFFSDEGKVSAKRYSVILRSLYNASYLSDENSQKILEILSATPFDDYLEAGVPDEIKFAHKIGIHRNEKVFLDSGIVYVPRRPYILTVMVNSKDENLAKAKMKEISGQVYNYVTTYHESE